MPFSFSLISLDGLQEWKYPLILFHLYSMLVRPYIFLLPFKSQMVLQLIFILFQVKRQFEFYEIKSESIDFWNKIDLFITIWSALEHTDTNRWLGCRPRLTTYIYFPIDLSALSLQNLACSVLINFPLICLGFCAQQNSKLFCCGFKKTRVIAFYLTDQIWKK